jgi:hypothetical protein
MPTPVRLTPRLSARLLKRLQAYSPITREQRNAMARALSWADKPIDGRVIKLRATEAQRIADAFRPPLVTVGRATVAGFLEYGDWLARLQERVSPGIWLSLFTDARGAHALDVPRPIPISSKQAQALLRIVKHPTLSNPDIIDQLPPHWRTLDTLTRVPLTELDAALTRGTVHARMERAEAEALLPPRVERPRPAPADRLAGELDQWAARAVELSNAAAIVRMLRALAERLERADAGDDQAEPEPEALDR